MIAVVGVLIGLTIPAVQRVRESANRTQCIHNLHQIGLALHNYHGAHQQLPPGATYKGGADPFYFMAWSTRILPMIEQDVLWREAVAAYAQTRFFILTPHPVDKVLPLYGCPTDPRVSAPFPLPGGKYWVAFTSYLGVEGTNQFTRDRSGERRVGKECRL